MASARGAVWMSAIVLIVACVTPLADLSPRQADELSVSLWLLDHGWHTAIAVRRADLDPTLWPEILDFAAATFVEIAWGDRDFYMATPATLWMAIRAAFGTGQSVLHVVGLDARVAGAFPGSESVELRVSRRGFEALTRFVADEHARDAEGRALRLRPGLYGPSWFYAARGHYSLANTCNTWIAAALHAAGLPVNPAGVITAGGVMRQVRHLSGVGSSPPF